MIKWFLIILTVLVIIVVAGVGIIAYLLFGKSSTSISGLMRPVDYGTSTTQQVADDALASIDVFISEMRGEGTAVPGDTVTLTLTEMQLTAIINSAISEGSGDTPISGILVNVNPDGMLMTGKATPPSSVPLIGGRQVAIGLTLTPKIVAGKLSLEIDDIQLGGLSASLIPSALQSLKDQIKSSLGEDLSLVKLPADIMIDSLELAQGSMTLTGTASTP